MSADDGTDDEELPGGLRDRLLSAWERFGAFFFGSVLCAAGVTAVFISENQAGTTALILIGAIFLIVGVQGTPISKASKDSVELRGRTLAKKAQKVARDESSNGAELFIEGAVAADPRLSASSSVAQVGGELYALRVRQAIELIGRELGEPLSDMHDDNGIDFALGTPNSNRVVGIVVKYTQRSALHVDSTKRWFQPGKRMIPILIVANAPILSSARLRLEAAQDYGVGFVRWQGAEDNDALKAEIIRLRNIGSA